MWPGDEDYDMDLNYIDISHIEYKITKFGFHIRQQWGALKTL